MVRGNFLSTLAICNIQTDIGNNPDPAGKKKFFVLSVCGCVEGGGKILEIGWVKQLLREIFYYFLNSEIENILLSNFN